MCVNSNAVFTNSAKRALTTQASNSRRGRLSNLSGATRAFDIISDDWRKPDAC